MSQTEEQIVNNSNFSVGISTLPSLDQLKYEDMDFFGHVRVADVVHLEIEQSLDMMYKTGKLVITDRSALRENFPLTGNEVFTIEYTNALHDSSVPKKIVHFRVFDIQEIPNKTEQPSQNSTFLHLTLVEFPAYDFLVKNTIYLSYPWNKRPSRGSRSVSNIITDVLEKVPNLVNWYDLEIDETVDDDENLFNFFVPHWTPMKTIKYLQRFAVSKNDNHNLFTFTTEHSPGEGIRPKFVFKSVYDYLDTDIARVYSTTHPGIERRRPSIPDEEIEEELPDLPDYSIEDYIHAKRFMYGQGGQIAFSRLSGKTIVEYDHELGNNYYGFTFNDHLSKYKSNLSLFSWHSQEHGNQWSKFETTPWCNENQIINNTKNEYNKLMIQSIGCKTHCHLNQLRKPGELAFLQFTSENILNGNIDLMYSGRWLTWSIKDIIYSFGDSASEVDFYKDGYTLVDSNNQNLTEIEMGGSVEPDNL